MALEIPEIVIRDRAMFKDMIAAAVSEECPEEASWRIAEAYRGDPIKVLTLLLICKKALTKKDNQTH